MFNWNPRLRTLVKHVAPEFGITCSVLYFCLPATNIFAIASPAQASNFPFQLRQRVNWFQVGVRAECGARGECVNWLWRLQSITAQRAPRTSLFIKYIIPGAPLSQPVRTEWAREVNAHSPHLLVARHEYFTSQTITPGSNKSLPENKHTVRARGA